MDIDSGNAHRLGTQGTGWFVGFSPWTLESAGGLRHVPQDAPVTGLSMKWYDHPDGHDSGNGKPLSEGRTLSILVSKDAEFHIDFSSSPDFAQVRTIVLREEGDYAAWGAGLFHRWQCVRRSTIATVRWNQAA